MSKHEQNTSRESFTTQRFETWLDFLDDANGSAVQRFLAVPAHQAAINNAPGSRDAHHGWRGGYREHLRQTFVHVHALYELWEQMGVQQQLPPDEHFTESDALTVMFLHDIEKPFIYDIDETGNVRRLMTMTKQERKAFRAEVIAKYGFVITPSMQNALQFVEGVRDEDYVPGKRADCPLAALCHAADNLSARGLYAYRGEI